MKLSNIVRIALALILAMAATLAFARDINPNPRPFSGVLTGEATFDLNEDCIGLTGIPLQTISSTTGDLTHMGNSEYYSTHCALPDGSALVGGEATIVAANGDELWLTYTGLTEVNFPAPVIVIDVDYVVVGGTGRFEGASGLIDGYAFVTFEGFDDPAWPLELTFAGSIVY